MLFCMLIERKAEEKENIPFYKLKGFGSFFYFFSKLFIVTWKMGGRGGERAEEFEQDKEKVKNKNKPIKSK